MRPSHRVNNTDWPRHRRYSGLGTVDVYEILKETWPAPGSVIYARPWSYKLAKERNWISPEEYWATKPVPTGKRERGVLDFLYEDNPFLKLVTQ